MYKKKKKSKSSSGKLCATGYPPSNSSLLGVIIRITTILNVIPQKRPYTYLGIAPGQKRYGINLQVFCPYPFFHLPLQEWLRCNATTDRDILPHHLPWTIYFPFTCWKLWLVWNERIFQNESCSQHSLIYATMQAAVEFYFLASTTRQTQARFLQYIRWHAPQLLTLH